MRRLIDSRSTPYNDLYPSCERAVAQLLIYCGELEPESITAELGISPTTLTRKGRISVRNEKQRVEKLSCWFLSSEKSVKSLDLRRHLDWLLECLKGRDEYIIHLQEQEGVTMRIDCIWWSASGAGGPTIWPEQMARMAALNLECSFDISFYGEDDDLDDAGCC